MKRLHLRKMSDLLQAIEIVSSNAKKKGHRSGYRCHELALQLAEQFEVFKPTLVTIIKNKEVKNKADSMHVMTNGEHQIYQVIRHSGFLKMSEIATSDKHNKSKNTTRQYVHILQKKGFVKSIDVIGKNHKYYKAIPLHFTTMDQHLIANLMS